jgi:acylphosphatase
METRSMITRHFVARGRVQGVGYRQFIYRNALTIGCMGWVRNRADGTVEAVIHGSPQAVEQLLDAARRGPRGARVEAIEVTPAEGSHNTFEIRPTA